MLLCKGGGLVTHSLSTLSAAIRIAICAGPFILVLQTLAHIIRCKSYIVCLKQGNNFQTLQHSVRVGDLQSVTGGQVIT